MRTNVFQVLKSVFAAVLFSLVFVLIFTVIIQLFSLPLTAVKPVNQVFKILAIVAGGLIFIRGDKGLIKCVIHGISSVIVTYLVFSLISMSFSVSWLFIVEIIVGAVAGAISGIIAVNIKKTS